MSTTQVELHYINASEQAETHVAVSCAKILQLKEQGWLCYPFPVNWANV